MNHEVNTFYPKDSGWDKSLLAFHCCMEGKKNREKEKKQTTTKIEQVSDWHLGEEKEI